MKKAVAKYYQIKSDKVVLSEISIRIVFISDLHNISIGHRNEILLDKIDSLSPDLVLIGGDTIVGKPGVSMDVGLDFIKEVAKRHHVYAANGNHEYRLKIYPDTYKDMYNHYLETLQRAGVTLLSNQNVCLIINETPIVIHGLELNRSNYKRFNKQELSVAELSKYLGEIEADKFHILLAHNPYYGPTYMSWGADLTLSGHYHGGIVRLPQNKALIGNDFQIFPSYAYGRHKEDGRYLIASAGLGEHTIPVRVNNPRELVVVDIIGNENKSKRG